jgi:hypothetical protein
VKGTVLNFPKLRAQASFVPSTLDAEARTVEVLFYSGASVMRFPYFDDPYELTFSLDPQAVRMERFENGASLVDNHRAYGPVSEVVLGAITKAWLAKDGGHAVVKIAEDRPEILARIRDGILRHFSMGAVIHQARDITEKGDPHRRILAIDWEPHELSIVPVGADPGAQALSQQAETFPCVVLSNGAAAPLKEKTMKVRLLAAVAGLGEVGDLVEILESGFDEKLHVKEPAGTDPAPAAADDKSEERLMQDAMESDTKRASRIRELATFFELDDVWAQRHIKLGSSIKAVIAEGQKKRAESAPTIDGRLTVGADYDSIGWKSARMTEALAARAMRAACPEPARAFERLSIAEVAFAMLEQRGETRGRALDPIRAAYEVVKLAMGTSDFPGLLANVLNKTLMPAYLAAPASFRTIAQLRQFRDYRPHRFVRAGDFPITLQVGEGGEVTEGAMGESSETVTALKYGRILNILWEVLVNDDVGAFNDFGGMVARRIVDRENALFYAICIVAGSGLGPALADAVAVYNAAHANVNSAGALSNDRLGEAFALMAVQTSIDGIKVNVPPRYVLTSATSHILARTLLKEIFPTTASGVNPFAGMIDPIYDANLTGVRYYVLADPARLPNYIYGTVNGLGPRFEVRQGFEVEGVQVKAVHDFGCGALDFRGGVTGAGS